MDFCFGSINTVYLTVYTVPTVAPQKSVTPLVDRYPYRLLIIAYRPPKRVNAHRVAYNTLILFSHVYNMPRTRAGVGLPSHPTPKGPIPTAPRPPTTPANVQPRRKNCELDVNLRTQITTLKEVAKWSYRQIHAKYPDLLLSTIKMTCLRSRIRHKEESCPRSGRLKILDEDDRQKILQKIHEDPRASHDNLLSEVSHKYKKDSIARLLTIEGLRK
jgi:hypothetical protein